MTGAPQKLLGLSISGARRLLIASLILNFLIIGAVFGLGLRGDDRKRPPGGAFGDLAAIVAAERRAEVSAIMERRGALRREIRQSRTEDWLVIADVIESEGFDAASVAATLDRLSDAHNERRKSAYRPLVEALAKMTPEERAAVARKTRAFAEWRAQRRK